jgi:hypothetical protein
MPFDHERLDVYQVALEFFDLADEIIDNYRADAGIWPTSWREPLYQSSTTSPRELASSPRGTSDATIALPQALRPSAPPFKLATSLEQPGSGSGSGTG